MKTEGEWKTVICSQLRDAGWYARRIEDQFGVGFPDMITKKINRVPMLVEAKMVRGRYFEPTARQLIDLRQLHNPPYCYAILLGIDDRKPKDLLFSFSEPMVKVDTLAETTFHHVNAVAGFMVFLDMLERKYK